MARSESKAWTPPKGRPTPKRGQRRREPGAQAAPSSTLQWAVLAILAAVVVVALVVFVGDGGGTPVHGVPTGGHGP